MIAGDPAFGIYPHKKLQAPCVKLGIIGIGEHRARCLQLGCQAVVTDLTIAPDLVADAHRDRAGHCPMCNELKGEDSGKSKKFHYFPTLF